MIGYTVKIDLSQAERFAAFPSQAETYLGFAFDRIELEAVRAARREAPRFQSLLTNSIHADRTGPYEVTVAPGVKYGEYVEGGTGPAAGQKSYRPPADALYEYVKGRASISFRNTRAGSGARGAQYDEIRDRAWALSAYIAKHGTKPNPYMARAAEFMEKRAPEIVAAQLDRLAVEVNRA